MKRGKSFQAVLLIASVVCAVWALMPGHEALAREGLFTVAAGLWFLKVEINRPKRSASDLRQLQVLIALGILLWRLADVPFALDYISGPESARVALRHILAQAVGILAVPSCLCFYLSMPVKSVRKRRALKRTELGAFKLAV